MRIDLFIPYLLNIYRNPTVGHTELTLELFHGRRHPED